MLVKELRKILIDIPDDAIVLISAAGSDGVWAVGSISYETESNTLLLEEEE